MEGTEEPRSSGTTLGSEDPCLGKSNPSPTGYRDYAPPVELVRERGRIAVGERDEDFAHKTILLGDSGVGKTSLLVRFDTGQFQTGNFAATVGIGFTNKVITVDESRVKLQIWDTAGQERFRSVTHAYYRDAHALLLLYDVTDKTSYDNIRAWLGEIREYAHDDVVVVLLGNKCDCGNERIVKREDGERLAREYDVPFIETSAKTGLNVELAFFDVARRLKARKTGQSDPTKFNVEDRAKRETRKNSCLDYNDCSTS